MIKRLGKAWLSTILEWQVQRLRHRHEFTVVAVAGSVGKTSVKSAIATTLTHSGRVRYQSGNYNDRLTVPLIFFGATEPAIFNIFAWFRVLLINERQIHRTYPFDVVVVELGTDGPGQIAEFAYLQPEIGVVTAVAEEHMEFFGTLTAVAKEELTLGTFAKQTIVNGDDIAPEYLAGLSYKRYGTGPDATYKLLGRTAPDHAGQQLELQLGDAAITIKTSLLGEPGAKITLAAAAVAYELGLRGDDLIAALSKLQAVAGRMQILAGQQDSKLLDDTYNASPVAVTAALDVLYASDAPQKIAILGSMNELGAESPALHQKVGAYCDPNQLDLVITIGRDAELYLAPAAIKAGCEVLVCQSPYEAGQAALASLKPRALVLAKGSQNGVFAEEALKVLLAHPADADKLVRQSPYWMTIKRRQFRAGSTLSRALERGLDKLVN